MITATNTPIMLSRRMAEYATQLTFSELPAATIEQTKKAVLDVLGIAIRAAGEPGSSAVVRSVVDALGGPGRAVGIGVGAHYQPHYAALLNATFAHTLDFDDTHVGGSIHPGAPLIPSALAIAEELGASGERLIAAIVAGYDVSVRISEAATPHGQYDRGFHPTATAGTFGSTAAVANVAGASGALLEHAFGINGSQAAGSLQFLDNGAWNKRLHVGFTAHNAILAYRLAKAGAQGASQPLEGRSGFFRGYTDGANPSQLTEMLGDRFAIDETAFKPYPSCRFTHAAIDLLLEILTEEGLSPNSIEHVRIGLGRKGMDLVGIPEDHKRAPQGIVDGQFSMYFCAAATLLRRRYGWDEYKMLGDPAIGGLIERISVWEDPVAERLYPRMAATVEVRVNGRTIRKLSDTPKGEPEKPMSWDDVIAKFEGLASIAYASERRRHIVETVRQLDAVANSRTLTALLGAP